MVDKIIIPKTETIAYLNTEIPSYEEFMKNWKRDEKVNDSYESEINANVELGKGYGPCSSSKCNCLPGERWTELKVYCPVPNCKSISNDSNKPSTWWHAMDFGDMEISNKARIRCTKCFYVLHIKSWKFTCSEHGGTPTKTNYKAFTTALSFTYNVETVHPEVMIELNRHLIINKREWDD